MNKNEGWILLFKILFYEKCATENLTQKNGWEMIFGT